MPCVNFEQIIPLDKSKETPHRFNTHLITDELLANLFDPKKGFKFYAAKVKDIIGSNSYYKKVAGIQQVRDMDNILKTNLDPADGKTFRERSIAFAHIVDGIKAERDLSLKNHLSAEEVSRITDNGVFKVNTLGLYTTIGREIVYSMGYRMSGDAVNISEAYAQVGENAVKELESTGAIVITEDANVINRGFLKPDGKKVSGQKLISGTNIKVNLKSFGVAVNADMRDLQDYLLKDDTSGEASSRVTDMYPGLSTAVDSSKFVRRLVVPSNLRVPITETIDGYQGDEDITQTARDRKVIKNLHANPVRLNPALNPLMQFIADSIENTTFTEAMANLGMNNKEALAGMFGMTESGDSTPDKHRSDIGRSLSKVVPFQDFIENFELFKNKPLHYTFQSIRTDRIMTNESVLDYQGDKFFARSSLVGADYTIDVGSPEHHHMVADLMDKSNLTAAQIGYKGDPAVDALIDEYVKTFVKGSNGKAQFLFVKKLVGDKTIGAKSVWYTLNVLNGIQSIRSAKSGKIASNYQTEPDATASGGLITLAQLAGKKEAVTDILKEMGIIKNVDENGNTIEPTLADIYAIVTRKIEQTVTEEGADPDVQNLAAEIEFLMDLKVFKNPRDLSKSPTMTFIYGQGAKGAIANMSYDMAEGVLDNASNKDLARIKEMLAGSDLDLSGIQSVKALRAVPGITAALANHYSDKKSGVAANLRRFLDSEIQRNLLSDNKVVIEEIFDEMNTVWRNTGEKPKMLPPSAFWSMPSDQKSLPHAAKLTKYGAPLSKVYETIVDGVLINKEFPNETNAFVNPQHMMDAAILKEALRRTYDELTAYPELMASMPVHDANNSNPIFNVKFQKHYRNAFKELNTEYDFVEQLLLSLESMKGHNPEALQRIRSKVEGHIEAKKAALVDMDQDTDRIFGFPNEVDLGKAPESSPAITLNTATEPNTTPAEGKFVTAANVVKDLVAGKGIPENLSVMVDPFTEPVSPIIDSFFNNADVVSVLKPGENYSFNAAQHSIEVPTGKPLSKAEVIQRLEHEITHFNTVGYLASNTDARTVQYVAETVSLLGSTDSTVMSKLSKEAGTKLHRILTMGTSLEQQAEFIAEMTTDENFSNEIYTALAKKPGLVAKLKKVIKEIVTRVKAFSPSQSSIDNVKSKGVDIATLAASIHQIVLSGTEFVSNKPVSNKIALKKAGIEYFYHSKDTEPSALEEAMAYREYEGDRGRYTDPLTETVHRLNNYTAYLIANLVEEQGKGVVTELSGATHDYLKSVLPMYARTANMVAGVWDSNTLVAEIRHYLNLDDFKREKAKRQMLSLFNNKAQERVEFDNKKVSEIDQLMTGMDTKTISDLNKLFAKNPIHLLGREGVLGKIARGDTTVDEEIALISARLSKSNIELTKGYANLYVNNDVTMGDLGYNHETKGFSADIKEDMETMIALQGIKLVENGETLIQTIAKDNSELYNRLIDQSFALQTLNAQVYATTKDVKHNRGNLVDDIFETPKIFKVVSERDLHEGRYSTQAGWTILKDPARGVYGIAVKDAGDESFQEGVGTNVSYTNNDIIVNPLDYDPSQYHWSKNNAVEVTVGSMTTYKLILTAEMRKKLKQIDNPAHSLMRSYSKLELIYQTEVIRQELVKDSFTFKLNNEESKKALQDLIADENEDNPWFVKMDDLEYDRLPDKIKAKYRQIDDKEKLSSVNGFREKVNLVRKDISPWLLGYKDIAVFEDNPTMRKAASVTKQLIKLFKIHIIIANPVKITKDIVSNTAYLIARGVAAQKIYKYGEETISELKSLEKLRAELLSASIRKAANPGNAKFQGEYDAVVKLLKEHPLSSAMNNGMIQSISTTIILKDYDTVSGLQYNIERIVNKLTRDTKTGELDPLAKAVMKFSKTGPGIGGLLSMIADKLPDESLDNIATALRDASKRIDKIKADDDIAKYVSQLIAAPDSEITRLGSAATQYADVIPRIILYKHLKDVGVSEEEAVKDVLESYIDYKINMPKEIKLMSDFGLMMFPAYWMRIQRIILKLAKRNPATVTAGLLTEEILGLNISTIVDSNLLTKFAQGGIFNVPEAGLDVILPTHLFG